MTCPLRNIHKSKPYNGWKTKSTTDISQPWGKGREHNHDIGGKHFRGPSKAGDGEVKGLEAKLADQEDSLSKNLLARSRINGAIHTRNK